jgi:flagellar biosynthesis/type III secretory pathway protein FliH
MTTEIRSDLARLLKSQYANGHAAGYAQGVEDGRALVAAMRRDIIVITAAVSAATGLLAGIFL